MLKSPAVRTFVTNSGIIVLGLVNSVLLSRWLGAAGRGEVAAAMLWPTLLIYISSMGMFTATLYFSALPESEAQTIWANGLVLAAGQGLIALPLGFLALPWVLASQSPSVVQAGRLYLAIIPLSLVTQYGISIILGRMLMTAFNALRLIVPVGYLLGVAGLWAAGQLTVRNIIILHLVLNLIALLGVLATLLRAGIRPSLKISGPLLKRMLKYGSKVQIGDISQVFNLRMDQVLMAALLPPAQLGLYVVAVSSAGLSQVLSTTMRMIITPSIARKESESERAAMLEEAFRKYWLLSILCILTLAVSLPFVLPLVFGAEFKGAVWPAEVLLWGALFIGGKDVLTGGAQAMGSPWLGSRAELASLVVTLVLLIILLPTMGIMGAAIATVSAYATQLVLIVYGLHHSHAVSPQALFRLRFGDLRVLTTAIYRARAA
jgi:O-antigen/teichoic acid export membrane protein